MNDGPLRPKVSSMQKNTPRRSFFASFRPLILDRYLAREFAIAFSAVSSFCALLLLIANVFGKFQDIMENNAPFWKVVQYFACSLPFQFMQTVPLVAALSVLFAIGALARNNEILAFMTNGVHALRIAAPIILCGLFVSGASIYANEAVIPQLEQTARYLERRYLEGKDELKLTSTGDVFARGANNRFYLMRRYSMRENRMYEPKIVDMTPDFSGLQRRIEAKSAVLVSKAEDRTTWRFQKPRIWTFDDAGNLASFREYSSTVDLHLEEDLSTLLSHRKQPDEMNFRELKQHIRILSRSQQAVHEYQTDLILKITFPLGVLVVMVIGFSYAARARSGSAMSAYGYGTTWAFLFYGLSALFKALGHSGSVAPMAAGLLPDAAFLVISVYCLRRSYGWYS